MVGLVGIRATSRIVVLVLAAALSISWGARSQTLRPCDSSLIFHEGICAASRTSGLSGSRPSR
eukprot:9404191-Pyramimonas_sp.AAC.1